MKKLMPFFALLPLLVACGGNDDQNECNFLPNVGVNASLNMNLPQYSQLQFPSNPVYVGNQGSVGGFFVVNTGFGFMAFDAADPNHAVSNCSTLSIDGIEGVCGCSDANTYSLITGQPLYNSELPCGLRMYVVEQSGNMLYVYN
ncbi:hypothetical protein [Mangrovimonas sp. TPBH4]|uniref:hypothetical protein n=1 Tax=Mangrovimonas sp. TPBH4 TaxID=1645914 RepID=UPI0006B41030|nr:hypothetical protein [Mangrovimonas sp. TPBH4]